MIGLGLRNPHESPEPTSEMKFHHSDAIFMLRLVIEVNAVTWARGSTRSWIGGLGHVGPGPMRKSFPSFFLFLPTPSPFLPLCFLLSLPPSFLLFLSPSLPIFTNGLIRDLVLNLQEPRKGEWPLHSGVLVLLWGLS